MAKTGAQKQTDRMNPLNAAARAAGFDGWRNYETAVIKGFPLIDKNSEFAPDLEAQTPIQLSNSRRCSKCGADSGQAHYGADHTIYCIEHCPNCAEPEPAPLSKAALFEKYQHLPCSVCGTDTDFNPHYDAEDTVYCKAHCPECVAKREPRPKTTCFICKNEYPTDDMRPLYGGGMICHKCMYPQPAPDAHLDDRGE